MCFKTWQILSFVIIFIQWEKVFLKIYVRECVPNISHIKLLIDLYFSFVILT